MKILASKYIAQELASATGLEVVPLQPYKMLDSPVSSHADMLFFILDNTVFCYGDYIIENNLSELIEEAGYNIVHVSGKCERKYPNDISLNVLAMGRTLFCHSKYTAKEILDYAQENGYKIVDVKQGYAACSTLVIDEDTAITTDSSIALAIKNENKRVLLINGEDILLPGYNCGFIGGASGKIGREVWLFGDAEALKYKDKIISLLDEKNCKIKAVSSGRVYDFGGFKTI